MGQLLYLTTLELFSFNVTCILVALKCKFCLTMSLSSQILIELETALLDDEPHWYKLQTHDESSLPLPQPSPFMPRRHVHGENSSKKLQSKCTTVKNGLYSPGTRCLLIALCLVALLLLEMTTYTGLLLYRISANH